MSVWFLRLLIWLLVVGTPISVLAGKQEESKALAAPPGFSGFEPSRRFQERTGRLLLKDGVRAHISAPPADVAGGEKKLLLIYYALPNGNTIEQTIGKSLKPGDDWHFNIQHLGAQTRFLREMFTDRAVVVACLENSLKSWPAWRKKYGDDSIAQIVQSVRKCLTETASEIVCPGTAAAAALSLAI